MSVIIKQGNIDGIKVLTHMFSEYDIVSNTNFLLNSTSVNNIEKVNIISQLNIFCFMFNYMNKLLKYKI